MAEHEDHQSGDDRKYWCRRTTCRDHLAIAASLHCTSIRLHVNRENHASIMAYRAMGFEKIDVVVTPIGHDMVMDDDVMERFIQS